MIPVLTLTMNGTAAHPVPPSPAENSSSSIDLYSFTEEILDACRGLVINAGCDQIFLERHRDILSSWVRSGGRLLVNGHPLRRFVDLLPSIRKLEFHGLRDVWLSTVDDHPIWNNVDRRDLLLRTGVPGTHTFEELTRIGVAGFYARNYLADIPEGSRIITGIGPGKLPVDLTYPLGDGEVIVHAGNDLHGFGLVDAINSHLGRERAPL